MRRKDLRGLEYRADPEVRRLGQVGDELRCRHDQLAARPVRGPGWQRLGDRRQRRQRQGPHGHQVQLRWKVLMTLGKPGVAGEGPETFNGPSDVLVAPNGDIFVADGHGEKTNARIVKFSKDGKFIKAWGKAGKGQG